MNRQNEEMLKLQEAEVIKEDTYMEGILKVTPEKLVQTSGEFASAGSQMKSLTGEMLSLIRNLRSSWQGEAATAYGNRFDSLSQDMDKLYRMVQEHAEDLQEMARQYQSAESGNTQAGNDMRGNVIV